MQRTIALGLFFAAMNVYGCGSSPNVESTGQGGEAVIGHCPQIVVECYAPLQRTCMTVNGCNECECEGATLHFANDADSLYASVGGGAPHLVQLDTGSSGLYVPESALGPSATLTNDACSVTYVSSGTSLSGHEATAQVALLGATTGGEVSPSPITVPMTVCAIEDSTFTGGVMGVGFGQHTTQTPVPDPSWNVLLQVQNIPNPGYVLSTHPTPSVTIGTTAAASVGFQLVDLTAESNGDWSASSLVGCVALPGFPSFSQCGPLLVDTGIADFLLWGPSDPTLGGAVPAGQTTVPAQTAMQVTSAAGAATLDYSFVVGKGSDSPSTVNVRSASKFSINTGRALLVDDDYLFDAVNGQVGFRADN